MLIGELQVSADAIAWTKQLVFKEELADGWKLFGKTGWSGSRSPQHGWFVGWIEKGKQFFPFAYLIEGETIDLSARIPRTKELLGH